MHGFLHRRNSTQPIIGIRIEFLYSARLAGGGGNDIFYRNQGIYCVEMRKDGRAKSKEKKKWKVRENKHHIMINPREWVKWAASERKKDKIFTPIYI